MKLKSSYVFRLMLLLIFFALSIPELFAQKKELTFNQVYMFAEPRLLKSIPSVKEWYDDEHYLQSKTEDGKALLMLINARTGVENLFLDYSEYDDQLIDHGLTLDGSIANTSDYDGFLFNKNNDLYFFSRSKGKIVRLTNDPAEEKNPTLSPDGKKVAYTRNRDLYVSDTETGKETRLTFDATEVVYNGWASWVYYEEILGRPSNYRAFWWSPNSEMIAFLRTDDSPVPKFPLYRADGNRGELEWEHYPKAGEPNPDVKLGIANLSDGKITWVDEDETVDQYTAWPFWRENSSEIFYQVLNRRQNHLELFAAHPKTGKNKLVYEEKQASFVEFFEDIYMFKNESGFILRSDVDGWRHLYYYDMNGRLIKKLTEGNWTVKSIALVDELNSKVYFTADKDNSLQTHLFSVELDGNNLTKLTSFGGTHRVNVSPNGSFFFSTYSNANTPQIFELFDELGNSVRVMGTRKSDVYDEYELGNTEFFSITTEDGVELPAMWILPNNFDESKKYPVLFSVYGGPGRNDVSDSYFPFLDRYFIAQSGIIYFVVDHRGSEHFGKNGTAMMYRNLGKWETHDYIEAVRWLHTKPFVDETKIGITGGSYGGYVSCLALTLGADYFTHGIADYSVIDWRLYDNIYTERYMDTPENNPEGYDYGSALTHADKYKGKLLIRHGTLDDNVHMQNTIQLVDKFTSLNKDFELMLYPNERHGVRPPKWKHASTQYINFWYRHFLGKEFEE